jgi:hypothetical protein
VKIINKKIEINRKTEIMDKHETYLIGVAQESISPELPCRLAGYFHERLATRIRDDIFVKVLAIDQLILVSCDLVALNEEIVSKTKSILQQECALNPNQILMCATHTHTAPEIRKDQNPAWVDDNYNLRLVRTVADTVKKAVETKFAATIHYGTVNAPEYSFNRLYRSADGSECFGRQGNDIIGSAGPVDSSVQTLLIRDTNKEVRAVVVNFACHPDVIGGGKADFVSADWPGEMAKNIAAVYGEHVSCLFLQGTAGDIGQHDFQEHYIPNSGPVKAAQMGRALAGAAMLAGEKAEALDDLATASICEYITIQNYTRDEEFMRHIADLKKKDERTYFENALIEKAEAWDKDGKSVQAPIHCMRLGNIAIVGFPAEIFTKWGLEVKQYSPAEHTMIVELAGGRITNYVSTTDQATRGAYGSIPVLSRHLEVDAGRLMVECAIKNLHKLWNNK